MRRTKLILQSRRIDVNDQTIDLVTEIIAQRFLLVCKVDHLVDRLAELAMWIDAKSCLLEPIERFPVTRERFASTREQIVGKHVELAPRDQTRIELPDGACRRVARIREARLSQFLTLGICFFENFTRDKNLSPHFNRRINTLRPIFQTQRNAANRARVWRYVFAGATVAARHATHQQLIFVV